MTQLIILIIQTAIQILQQQKIGGSIPANADSILQIISIAKTAYEKETGQPLDVNKIKPYEPI